MTDLPMPLLPSDVDLRDFGFMPLQVERLRRSKQWLIAKRRPEIGFFSINLWMAAWHEVPCGSLEDDDDVLADAAMCSPDKWPSVKEDVLRGWFRCSDGRLYHPVVCEKAADAWSDKLHYRWRKECDRIRKENERRRKRQEPELDYPAEPQRISAGAKADNARTVETNTVSDQSPHELVTRNEPNIQGQKVDIREMSHGHPAENALKVREGKGEVRDNNISSSFHSEEILVDLAEQGRSASAKPCRSSKPRKHEYPADAFELWWKRYPRKVDKGAAKKAFTKVQNSDAVAFSDLIDGVALYVRTKPHDRHYCNPATWLNGERWLDEPENAGAAPYRAATPASTIDFGNGCSAPRDTIRKIWSSGKWPPDWGPPPGQQGCRIPADLIEELTRERVA